VTGYRRPLLELVFDDPELEGLRVRARRATVGMVIEMTAARERGDSTGLADLVAMMAPDPDDPDEKPGLLVDWNLEDPVTEQPVPLTRDGLMGPGCDPALLWAIAAGITSAIASVKAPLSPASSGGDPSLEESMPMDMLPPSQESSPTPA
jgi:hypothetical protein